MKTVLTKQTTTVLTAWIILFASSIFFTSCEKEENVVNKQEEYSTFVITARSPQLKVVRLTSLDNQLELDVTYEVAAHLTGIQVEEWERGYLILTEPTDSTDYIRHEIPELYQQKNTKYYWMVQNVVINKEKYIENAIYSEDKIYMHYEGNSTNLSLNRNYPQTRLSSIIANTTVKQYEGFKGVIINWFRLPQKS